MGNITSSTKKTAKKEFENFYDVVDYVATYYILTMDFKSLSKLSEKEYCDKLIILTADIIEKYFNEHEITYLEQRVKDGIEVNTLNKEKFVFIDKDMLDSLDISNDTKKSIQKNIKKNRVCIGIAKFYVKIAHIFAAIVMTINPVYTYTDSNTGATMKTSLLEKDEIPKKSDRKLFKLNICDNRIRALQRDELIDEETKSVILSPEICDINNGAYGATRTLEDEPGIKELMQLYYDQYDSKTGTFTGMTPETSVIFEKDLKLFYTAFTGEQTMPPEIKTFSDIKLKDYDKTMPNCQGPDAKFKSKVKIQLPNDLFVAYADNLKRMIQTAADNQIKLLDVINQLFTYTIDTKTEKRIIRVNPKLTERSLQDAVEKTRKYIMDLYIKCETDYQENIKIYTALVESKNAEIIPRQIDSLTSESDNLIQNVQIPVGAIESKEEQPPFIIAKGVNDVEESKIDMPPPSEPLTNEQMVLPSTIEPSTSEPMMPPFPSTNEQMIPPSPSTSEQMIPPSPSETSTSEQMIPSSPSTSESSPSEPSPSEPSTSESSPSEPSTSQPMMPPPINEPIEPIIPPPSNNQKIPNQGGKITRKYKKNKKSSTRKHK